MATPPSLITEIKVARLRQTVSDQLVLGLVTGGFLGPGLSIERREAQRILFRKLAGGLSWLPDRGEILLSQATPGETVVEFRLWCRGMRWRRALIAALGAAGAAAASLSILPGNPLIAAGVALAAGTVVDLTLRRRDRVVLLGQIRAYVHNSTFLKTM